MNELNHIQKFNEYWESKKQEKLHETFVEDEQIDGGEGKVMTQEDIDNLPEIENMSLSKDETGEITVDGIEEKVMAVDYFDEDGNHIRGNKIIEPAPIVKNFDQFDKEDTDIEHNENNGDGYHHDKYIDDSEGDIKLKEEPEDIPDIDKHADTFRDQIKEK